LLIAGRGDKRFFSGGGGGGVILEQYIDNW
jgi:hypothetical protein